MPESANPQVQCSGKKTKHLGMIEGGLAGVGFAVQMVGVVKPGLFLSGGRGLVHTHAGVGCRRRGGPGGPQKGGQKGGNIRHLPPGGLGDPTPPPGGPTNLQKKPGSNIPAPEKPTSPPPSLRDPASGRGSIELGHEMDRVLRGRQRRPPVRAPAQAAGGDRGFSGSHGGGLALGGT